MFLHFGNAIKNMVWQEMIYDTEDIIREENSTANKKWLIYFLLLVSDIQLGGKYSSICTHDIS